MWIYTVASFTFSDELNLRDELNEFGKIGWELVCMEWLDSDLVRYRKNVICTFKKHMTNH